MDEGHIDCPVSTCDFSGPLDTVTTHIEEAENIHHSWAALGFSDSAEFKRVTQAQTATSLTSEAEFEPCPLTELYEAFRGVRTALLMAIRAEESDVTEGDLTEPVVQYERVLAAFTGTTETESGEILGYGPQHVERVDHKVAEYRSEYGNGEWIIDYRCIEVEPLRQNTRHALSSYELVEYPSLLVRPVTPRTKVPVPELVMTESEVQRALSVLARFPQRPPTAAGQEGSSDTFPVIDVYHAILEDTEIAPVEFGTETIQPPINTQHQPSETTPHWRSSPAALASPNTEAEVDDFLARYGKLTHLFRWAVPPADAVVEDPVPVFALDFYDPVGQSEEPSQHSYRILSFAKDGEDQFRGYFINRVRDFVYRRLLQDSVRYDYITVYPGHKAESLSQSLVELAKQSTVETPIVYANLLERTETTEKQSEQDADSRWDVARNPDQTLRVRHQLSNDRVIVLDDVSTSGGSLATAAYLLRQAGAAQVIGLALGLTRSQNRKDTREIKSMETRASDIICENE